MRLGVRQVRTEDLAAVRRAIGGANRTARAMGGNEVGALVGMARP
jgi:hypothetical protein